MRRPRGPGGRFLTAEEIAAQKIANGEEPDPGPSPQDHDEEPEDLESPLETPIDNYETLSHQPQMHGKHRSSLHENVYTYNGHNPETNSSINMLNVTYHPLSHPGDPRDYSHHDSHSEPQPQVEVVNGFSVLPAIAVGSVPATDYDMSNRHPHMEYSDALFGAPQSGLRDPEEINRRTREILQYEGQNGGS